MEEIQAGDLDQKSRNALGMVSLVAMQDEAKAMEILRSCAEAYPGFIPARLNLAALLLGAGMPDDSEAAYRSILFDFPEDRRAIGGLATVFSAKGEHANAEVLARQALEGGYDWAPLFVVLAEYSENQGDLQEASRYYLEAYRRSPHTWSSLERYCRLAGRTYKPPTEGFTDKQPTGEQLDSLIAYIDAEAHAEDCAGKVLGCDHSFRFTDRWAEANGVDVIDLYQYLNAAGGFCDCEVCFNIGE